MTLRASARLAGLAFLLYFITGIIGLALFGQAAAGDDTAAKLASIAHHATLARATAIVLWLEFLYLVVLGVALHALTRDQDRDLSLLGMACRFSAGVLAAIAAGRRLDLIAVATASTAPGPDGAAARALGASLLRGGGGAAELCFTLGSLVFAWLFLRARSIPAWLARVGVLAAILWLAVLVLQILELLHGPAADVLGIPLAAYEVVLAVWLIIKGAAAGSSRPVAVV